MRTHRGSTTRAILIIGVTLLILGGVGVVVFRTMGPGTGGLQNAANRLEDWIASQIVGVANSYLVPQLDYQDIDYQAPRTVQLDGVTLTAPDGTEVLALKGMTVTLAEIPRIGQPILVSNLVLDTPTIRLVRDTKPDGSRGFRGLSPITKAKPTSDDDVDSNFKLSNVLRLEKVEIADGELFLDPGNGSPPMTIAGLTTTINSTPDTDKPGWYTLDIDTRVGPLLGLVLRGQLSLDTFLANIDTLTIDGVLDNTSASALPSALQNFVNKHNAAGHINLTASGGVPLTDPLAADITFQTTLTDFNLADETYKLPINRLTANGSLSGGTATIPALSADMLKGTLTADCTASLADSAMPASVNWRVEAFDLIELLAVGSDAQGRLAGILNANGSVTTSLADPRGNLAGQGEAHVREGRVLILPGLTELASLMNVAVRQNIEPRHKADATFNLSPQGLEITSSEVTTEFLAARATGTVGFDKSLDLAANAGPMEKLQSLLGQVGNVLGNVTDRLVKYRIRGTTDDPKVSIAPLGIGG